MLADPETQFTVRLNTNEMIERERLALFFEAIEEEARSDDLGGSKTMLLLGAVHRGSLLFLMALASISCSASVMIPGLMFNLKRRAGDSSEEPNGFAMAIADIMVQDSMSSVDFSGHGKTVTISKDEVPYVKKLTPLQSMRHKLEDGLRVEDLDDEGEPRGPRSVEDEDQDWIPTIEAADFPPREAQPNPSGYLNSISLKGAFDRVITEDGTEELRFFPDDASIAPYFVVTSNSYEAEPEYLVNCDVIGNVTLGEGGAALIEVLQVDGPSEHWLVLRHGDSTEE